MKVEERSACDILHRYAPDLAEAYARAATPEEARSVLDEAEGRLRFNGGAMVGIRALRGHVVRHAKALARGQVLAPPAPEPEEEPEEPAAEDFDEFVLDEEIPEGSEEDS